MLDFGFPLDFWVSGVVAFGTLGRLCWGLFKIRLMMKVKSTVIPHVLQWLGCLLLLPRGLLRTDLPHFLVSLYLNAFPRLEHLCLFHKLDRSRALRS